MASVKFWDSWNKVKRFIQDLVNLGSNTNKLQYEAAVLAGKAKKAGNMSLYKEAKSVVNRTLKWGQEPQEVSQKVVDHLPEWKKKASEPTSGFGFVSIILGVSALTALVWVANRGMTLLKDYSIQKQTLALIRDKVIKAEEASNIIESSSTKTAGSPLEIISSTAKATTNTVAIAVGGVLALITLLVFFSKK